MMQAEQIGQALLPVVCPGCINTPAFLIFKQVFGSTKLELNSTGGLGCERTGTGFACGAGTKGRLSEFKQQGLIIHE
jgi:hypothetical protein